MADSGYESVLCVKNEVFVYRIPPRPSNRGYRASEWKLDAPDWTGRLRVVAVNKELFIKLEDKSTGELFAQCPVDMYPGIAVEAVMDSSRYFVLQIKDPSGRSAFIGIGFADRSDSFDLNVALQDHFKWIKQEQEAEKAATELTSGPKLDLGFKAGQTITLNLGNKKGDAGGARSKPKPRAMGGMLPPPPGGSGGIKLPPPSTGGGSGVTGSGSAPPPGMQSGVGGGGGGASASSASSISSSVDLLLDLAPSPSQSSAPAPMAPPPPAQPPTGDLWGDFAGANNSSAAPASSASSNASNWVQF